MSTPETMIGKLIPSRALRKQFNKRFGEWLNRRIPPQSTVTLDQRRIFIMPNRYGLYFGLLLACLLIAGINYQNSLSYALTFMLSSLFVVTVLHTYRNMSGLTITAGHSQPAFAGEDAGFSVIFSRHGERLYEAIYAGWPGAPAQTVDLVEDSEVRLHLYTRAPRRGILRPGRMKLETFYPVGMIRSWSFVDLDMECIVYPKPIPAGPVPPALGGDEEGDATSGIGSEDYAGIREYRPGDSLKQIAWKSYARGQGLHTKEFEARVDRRVWLDWDAFPGMDRENRLSRLCYWVIEHARKNAEFGLRLPGVEIEPDCGPEHRDRCLRTLALFEIEQ